MVAFGFGSMLDLAVNYLIKLGFIKSWFSVYLPADYCSSRFNTYAHFGIVHWDVMTIADMFRPAFVSL
jgi:hypothetical protein